MKTPEETLTMQRSLSVASGTKQIAVWLLIAAVVLAGASLILALRDKESLIGSVAPSLMLITVLSLLRSNSDLPQLDTLILAMPLSFKGRLIQYAGRLHRVLDGKAPPRIYDYLDENSPLTRAMFRRRSVGYRQMGYKIELSGDQEGDVNELIDISS